MSKTFDKNLYVRKPSGHNSPSANQDPTELLKMSVREIITLGHPALWKKAEKVNDVADDSVKALMTDLRDTLLDFLKRNGFGRGIAAPQINVLKRIVYVVMPDGSFDGPLINPEIVATEGDLVPVWDDCFSLPGLKVKVSRFDKIRVEYLNEKEQKHTLKAEGGLAELLQHEIDHLDGILATDRAASPRDLVSVVEWERRFRKEESS